MKEFINMIKEMNENLYGKRLNKLIGRHIIIFNANLDFNLEKLRQIFIDNEKYYICLPDQNIQESQIPHNVELIKLSELQNFTAKNKSAIFIPPDYVNWLFWPIVEMNSNDAIINCIENAASYDQTFNEILNHIDEVYEVFSSLDTISKNYYKASLINKINGDISVLKFAMSEQYFLAGFLPKRNDIVIDAGSLNGATAKEFVDLGCQVYSFELDKINYNSGLGIAKESGFVLENIGLGSMRKKVRYNPALGGTTIRDNGAIEGDIIDLDTYLMEKSLNRVDFIKMDIEGSELDALKGARKTISKYKPQLAICMYHKLEDMWEIPIYIKELRSDYEFAFRQYYTEYSFSEKYLQLFSLYSINPELIPCHAESVLYCK